MTASFSTEDNFLVLHMDGMLQSALSNETPTRLYFDYMRRICNVINRLPPGPLRILHVGGGALTIARYVFAIRPRSSQIVLEPNVQLIELVRKVAPLPPRSGIKVRAVDGLTGIAAIREESLDVVILDAFEGGAVPDDLLSAEFFGHVRRVLKSDGVYVANLVDKAPFPVIRSSVARARTIGADIAVGVEPATLKGRRGGNLVVAAGTLPASLFGTPAPSAYRVYEGAAVSDSFGGG